jgi:hypothetical protein
MAAISLRLLAHRLLKPRPLSNGVFFERQNKTIIIITQIYDWTLLYRLSDHGASLRTLYRRAGRVQVESVNYRVDP